MTSNTLDLNERRQYVLDTLRPDNIRNHRVAEGLELSNEQIEDLENCAKQAAIFAGGMAELSQCALDAEGSDRQMRTIRELLGTEGLFQARVRGEIAPTPLPAPQITKVDLINTPSGLRIVEIEPGKIRGIGYGMLVRGQDANTPGIGAEATLASLSQGELTGIVMSRTDRFHEPEMHLLARAIKNLRVVPQTTGAYSVGYVAERAGAEPIRRAVMMSKLEGKNGICEQNVRQNVHIVSDRRTDLESKGALAILHNLGEEPRIEATLCTIFGTQALAALRQSIPLTAHISLLSQDQQISLRNSIKNGSLPVFLKPLADSGTRGIITPSDKEQLLQALYTPKQLRKFAIQVAHATQFESMESLDVLHGDRREDAMNIRITMHVDSNGNMIEVSVVGSPHEYLPHGGKTSVITNTREVNER
jgi:hypothetical protein